MRLSPDVQRRETRIVAQFGNEGEEAVTESSKQTMGLGPMIVSIPVLCGSEKYLNNSLGKILFVTTKFSSISITAS